MRNLPEESFRQFAVTSADRSFLIQMIRLNEIVILQGRTPYHQAPADIMNNIRNNVTKLS